MREVSLVSVDPAKAPTFYLERHCLCSALLHLWATQGYTIGIAEPEPHDPPWRWCVYADTPEGQMSWHFPESLMHLYADFPRYTGTWDGHTTAEKYERLERLTMRHQPPRL